MSDAAFFIERAQAIIAASEPRLPVWSDGMRAAPLSVVRSALFGPVIRDGQREALEDQVIASWPGNTVRYTGERLDQSDYENWLQSLHICKEQNLGDFVIFTRAAFLRALGRRKCGQAMGRLDASLRRMFKCTVEIEAGDYRYAGHLIDSYHVEKRTDTYALRLNKEMRQLFEHGYIRIDWPTRIKLSGDLTKWLHDYAKSHRATSAQPHRISIDTIRTLRGSKSAVLRSFRAQVRRAMQQLQERGVVHSWSITKNDALEFAREK